MMDESPEPTMVLRTLKDFNDFISSGTKRESMFATGPGSSRLRLNFSDVNSDCSSICDDSRVTQSSRKRPLDALTGLNVTKKFREKDTELAEAKTTITMLEGRLQNVEMAAKKARVDSETELEDLKRKQLRDKELIDDLQHKIKRLQGLQKEAQEEALKVKQQCNTSTYEAETRVVNMQREYLDQNNRLCEEVAFLRQRVMELETEVEEKTIEAENAQCHSDELLEQLTVVEEKGRETASNNLQIETLELQLEQAKAKIKDLEMQREELAEAEKKSHIFESAAAKMYNLEKENGKLREENKFLKETAINSKLLEEKIVTSKQQIMQLQARCEDIAHYQAKADQYKNQVKTIEEALMEELNLTQKPTVEEVKKHIAKLKREDFQLTTGIEQLSASQRCMETSRLQAEEQLKIMTSKLAKQSSIMQQNVQIIKRLQRKLLLLTKERDSLKNVLTTYEAELTINYSTVSQERIEKLESQLESYREELELMEEELEQSYKSAVEGTETPKKRDRSERILAMEKRMTELDEEIKKLTEANEKLTEKNEVLEGKMENLEMKGDYDPASTKVLQFKNNPLATAVESHEKQLETLEIENDALRERIRLLEEGEDHDLTQKVGMKMSEGHTNKDVADLQEKISSIETQNKRLMELFKKKSLEMREAIYRLTGYRVDSTTDNHYKLTNMFAESTDDFFLFELASNNELQLLETEYSNSLPGFIDTYLRRKNCLPAFLSAVTLDLFRKHSLESLISAGEEMDEEEIENIRQQEQMRSQLMMDEREDMPEDEEEDMEDEEEMEEEEEEEEHDEGEEAEDDDGDDLICLD